MVAWNAAPAPLNCPTAAIRVTPGVGCAAYIISGWIHGKENASCGGGGWMLLNPPIFYQFCKILEAAVVGAFGIVGEDAGRQLAHGQVVFEALAADSLARTGFV